MQFSINYVAVIVSAIAAMVVGAIWFGLFSKQWLAAQGKSSKEIKKMMSMAAGGKKPKSANAMMSMAKGDMMRSYIVTFMGAIVTALVMSILLSSIGVSGAVNGAMVGVLAWLGFIAPVMAGGVLWEGRSIKLYNINVAHQLLNLIVMGAILGAMGS